MATVGSTLIENISDTNDVIMTVIEMGAVIFVFIYIFLCVVSFGLLMIRIRHSMDVNRLQHEPLFDKLLSSTFDMIQKSMTYTKFAETTSRNPERNNMTSDSTRYRQWRYELSYRCCLFVKASIVHLMAVDTFHQRLTTKRWCCCKETFSNSTECTVNGRCFCCSSTYTCHCPRSASCSTCCHFGSCCRNTIRKMSSQNLPYAHQIPELAGDELRIVLDDEIETDHIDQHEWRQMDRSSRVPHLLIRLIRETICTYTERIDAEKNILDSTRQENDSSQHPSALTGAIFEDQLSSIHDMVHSYDGLIGSINGSWSTSTSSSSAAATTTTTKIWIMMHTLSECTTQLVVWTSILMVIVLSLVIAMVFWQPDRLSALRSTVGLDDNDSDDNLVNESEKLFMIYAISFFSVSFLLIWIDVSLRMKSIANKLEHPFATSSIVLSRDLGQTENDTETDRDDNVPSSSNDQVLGQVQTLFCCQSNAESLAKTMTPLQRCDRFIHDVLNLLESVDGPEWAAALRYKLHPNSNETINEDDMDLMFDGLFLSQQSTTTEVQAAASPNFPLAMTNNDGSINSKKGRNGIEPVYNTSHESMMRPSETAPLLDTWPWSRWS